MCTEAYNYQPQTNVGIATMYQLDEALANKSPCTIRCTHQSTQQGVRSDIEQNGYTFYTTASLHKYV